MLNKRHTCSPFKSKPVFLSFLPRLSGDEQITKMSRGSWPGQGLLSAPHFPRHLATPERLGPAAGRQAATHRPPEPARQPQPLPPGELSAQPRPSHPHLGPPAPGCGCAAPRAQARSYRQGPPRCPARGGARPPYRKREKRGGMAELGGGA